MTPRRRVLLVAAGVLVLALLVAAPALAAAGGGSSGFGGGGGGRGAGLYILFQILIRVAIFGHGLGVLIIIAVALGYVLFTRASPHVRGFYGERRSRGHESRRRLSQRERRVSAAAAEAAEEDEAFAPDAVRSAASTLFAQVQAAWTAEDHVTLRRLVGPRLLGEWERRLADFRAKGWHNEVEVLDTPTVQYVGLTRGQADQVVVRIQARMRDVVHDFGGRQVKRPGHFGDTTTLLEYWTLQRRGDDWQLVSIEQGAEGAHALNEQLVATAASDDQALHDEALLETTDAVPAGTDIAELADLSYDGDARAAALDLSLADGRFAPDVLEVSARRAVSAWAQAIDGDATRLRRLATTGAITDLLHPGDPSRATRLVVRGPQITKLAITGLDAQARPPRMTVDIQVKGRRYIEDRATTAVVSGDPTRERTFIERWTFALTGDDAQPWRVVAAAAPAQTR
jgi:predicted lipid-binding transport protein (Tim44 family)